MKYVIILFVIACSCTPRPTYIEKYKLQNNSGVDIKIAFKNASLPDTVILLNNSIIDNPIPNRPTVSVIYEDLYIVIHYPDNEIHTGKYLNMLSDRSLYSKDVYSVNRVDKGDVIEITRTFTFTEEDYNFARQ